MAKLVFTDGSVTINAVDLSDHIASITLNQAYDERESTSIADTAQAFTAGGLERGSVSIEFQQDFAASEVEATINGLVNTLTTVVIKPTTAAVSATNPSYTFSALVTEWSPIDAAAGDLVTVSVTWPISGGVTRAES